MEIHDALEQGPVFLDLKADDIRSAIERTVDRLIDTGRLSGALRERVLRALMSREIETTTAIGASAAVPHAHLDALPRPIVTFVRLARPLDLRAPDGAPTRFLIMLLGPTALAGSHPRTLAKIARMMSDVEFRQAATRARSREELLEAYERHRVRLAQQDRTPPGTLPTGPTATGVPFGGILNDIRSRLPYYLDDLRNGLSVKCLASVFFMYFACLAPAVAFGGLMSVMTGGEIGVVKMLLATAACGSVYALASGQPLTVLAGTGPLLIFTGILYKLCGDLGLPFLPVYGWVGLWTALFLIAMAALDACALLRYLTRFTDEIFAALIASIFIVEAIKDLARSFTDPTVRNDTALLSLLLALGTYYVAMSLARFRRSLYLRLPIREFLADFGPTIAIGSMTVVAVLLSQVELRRLPLPESLDIQGPVLQVVDLFAVPIWVIPAAAGPALLAAVLVFLNQNITTRLIDSPENRLSRPTGYHLNLALVGLLIGACSPVALPWLMASVIPSLNHMRSLATVEEVTDASGQARQKIVGVQENRLSPLAIHLLIGLSLLLLPVLKTVPMPVLFGLFLYMGVSSLTTNQFFERLKLWLMDPALYPPTHYIRKLPIWTVHKYTLIQAACLAILWMVQASPAGILFPLLIGLLVPLRLEVLPRFLDRGALALLDSAGGQKAREEVSALVKKPPSGSPNSAGAPSGRPEVPLPPADELPRIITRDNERKPR